MSFLVFACQIVDHRLNPVANGRTSPEGDSVTASAGFSSASHRVQPVAILSTSAGWRHSMKAPHASAGSFSLCSPSISSSINTACRYEWTVGSSRSACSSLFFEPSAKASTSSL